MTSIAIPFFKPSSRKPSSSKPNFDIGPITRGAVWVAATALSVAAAVAVIRWLTGLAPDIGHYRNLAISLHVITVLPAVPLGAYLLLTAKGTARHKMLGKLWVGLMVTTAIAITFVRGGTDFSWIHIFVPYTLIGSWKVVSTARKGNIAAHKKHLVGMYLGALVIPGVWSFLPDRMMGIWLFG